MKKILSFLVFFAICLSASIALAQLPKDYVSVYTVKGEAEKAPVTIAAKAQSQLIGPANGWGNMADWDFSGYEKLVLNITFDPADAGNVFVVRVNVNATATESKVKAFKFALPETGTTFNAEISIEDYAEEGIFKVGGLIVYNGATHFSFNYDGVTATSMPMTVNYVALKAKPDLTKMPEDYVSIYTIKGEAEKAPVAVGAVASFQLAGPPAGWGNMADWDFSKYRKLAINVTFDPADAGKMFVVRMNTNATATESKVKAFKFTLPETGNNFSAVIELEQYAEEGKVMVGGIFLYNGATHFSFNYDGATPTSMPLTVNYVALADEIIDLTKKPEDYVSIYTVKGEAEKAPVAVGAVASFQLAGPPAGWGNMADWDFSKYEKLVINVTFDPADAGKMFVVRMNTNATATESKVKAFKFTLPETGNNFSAVIELEQYREEGKVMVGGIFLYNGATHFSFNYDGATPTSMPITVNYVAVGPYVEEPVKPTTEFLVNKLVDGTVTDDADFKVVANMRWDADSVYVLVQVNDELIYNGKPEAYLNDNVELYFDMDNSKLPTWPRNAQYPATAYDANDFQLRIRPSVAWENALVKGVNLKTTIKTGGYDIAVNIPWKSMKADFTPAAGTKIGFDILASDNDNDQRNQLTWNAPSVMPWNDASLFGTLELLADGTFKPIFDTTAPDAPVVTATADESTVKLEWALPNDNIAVYYYDVKQDGVVVKEKIYAAQTGNSYTVNDLADGTYKFTVVCYDNSGNSSTDEVEVIVKKSSASDIVASFKAYPNPSTGIVNVSTSSNNVSIVDVFSLVGERIMRKSFVNNCSLDLSNVKKGIYILNVSTDNKIKTMKVEIR